MHRLYLILIIFLFAFEAVSQQPVLHWAKAFHSNNTNNYRVNNNGRTVGVDGQGNVYSAGLFEHSIDCDPGPGVFTLTGGSPHNFGIYISKLDASGNFVWAKQIPTIVEWGQIELKVDISGNIYIASDLRNSADMDPGPGVHIMTPTGFGDAFVVKLNSDGNLVWARKFGGPGDTGAQAYSLDVDQDNNVIIGGIFNNTVDFDPGSGTLNLTASAHQQAFLVKLNSSGNLVWARQFGNGSVEHANSRIADLKCDTQGNIVITGSFSRTCDFDPGPADHTITSSPGSIGDGFIVKLDANSNLIWVKTFGQTGGYNHYINPLGIEIDGMNNIVSTGYFIGNFDFDPGPGVVSFFSNPSDCFILKLDEQGNFIWAKTIGGSLYDSGHDVVTDIAGNVYVIGSFGTSVDFDPGPGVFIINSPYYGASAVVKLTAGGDFIYAAPVQSLNYGTTHFRRMAIDADMHIYVSGSVSGENDFDPGPAVYPLAGHMDSAPFVLKLGPCLNATSATLNISVCDSYTLNNQSYSSSGTYVQTIPNVSGCDSVITLHLAVNKKMVEQIIAICEGETFLAGGTAQNVSGTYYDTLQTAQGCDSIIVTRLTINPKPSPDLGADKGLCRNTQLTLTPGTFVSYLWQDNSTAPNFTVNAAGIYWVEVTNDFNCVAVDSFTVTSILEPPANFLQKTDSLCSYQSLELMPTRTYTSYLWSTGEVQQSIEIKTPGNYQLTVTDQNGCSGTDSTVVFSKQCVIALYIPTAFTPNGDGKNDIFKPHVFGPLKQYHMVVYNRWGAVVFQSSDPMRGWDGRIAGMPQDNAVFVWICTYQLEGSASITEKGTVMLLR